MIAIELMLGNRKIKKKSYNRFLCYVINNLKRSGLKQHRLLCHSFCGSAVQAWRNQNFDKAAIKVYTVVGF